MNTYQIFTQAGYEGPLFFDREVRGDDVSAASGFAVDLAYRIPGTRVHVRQHQQPVDYVPGLAAIFEVQQPGKIWTFAHAVEPDLCDVCGKAWDDEDQLHCRACGFYRTGAEGAR